MKQWLERHAQTLVGSLGRLWTQPFATLLTIMVIGTALALPACLHVLVQNVRAASGGWGNALDISVYMKADATLEQVATLLPGDTRALLAVPGVGARKLEAYGEALLALVRGETPTAAGDPDDPA